MTIKQQGGVFGRHPEFSTIEVTDGADMSATAKPVQTLDRSDDGDIIRLEVNGSYVGAIGGRFGDLTIGTGSIGFRFDNTTKIVPWNMNTNLATNGVMDLGVTGAAFKNLYLTENVVIGTSGKGIDFSATSGTGTSELFDDYEEGTWTPTGCGAGAVGVYTKMGDTVFAYCEVKANSVSTDTIGGLPFTVGAGNSAIGGYFGRARFAGIFDANGNEVRIRMLGTEIKFMNNGGLAGDAAATITTAAGGIVQLAISVIYKV